ncbi:MAG: TolC family protein, partial [Bacteroidaceae bacterium]|nr:TolC family protein [Bacteroidaceae bacterium]
MMKKKKGIMTLVLALALMSSSGFAEAGKTAIPQVAEQETLLLTLERAIQIALAVNPTIRIAEQDVQLKELAKLETTMGLLPEANLSGSYQRTIEKQTMVMNNMQFKVGVNNMYSGGLSISLPVFAPALYKSMNLTRTDVELALESARASKQDLVCQVTKAFYQLMLAQDSYAVLQKSLAQSEENFRIVAAKYDEGRVSEYDKISAEVQMRNLQPSVISARNAVDLSKLQLKVLMGVTADVDVAVEGNLKDYEEQMYTSMLTTDSLSLEQNSSLMQMDLNSRLLQNTLAIQKTNFMPNIALQFNYMYTCMADNFD